MMMEKEKKAESAEIAWTIGIRYRKNDEEDCAASTVPGNIT